MTKFHQLLVIASCTPSLALAGPGLDQAEVKIPYGELRTLLADATQPDVSREPLSALLSARFRLAMVDGKAVIDATFRTATFSDGLAMIPLVGGEVTVESQKPADARILIQGEMLCLAQEKAGAQVLEMRLLPEFGADGASLVVPSCPAAIFETGELSGDRSVEMTLLACDVAGQAAIPVNLGEGKLELTLPAAGQKTRVSCSFTGRTAALDPVEGTVELALPKTPLFIRARSLAPAHFKTGHPRPARTA